MAMSSRIRNPQFTARGTLSRCQTSHRFWIRTIRNDYLEQEKKSYNYVEKDVGPDKKVDPAVEKASSVNYENCYILQQDGCFDQDNDGHIN